jgi:hypothetical protein
MEQLKKATARPAASNGVFNQNKISPISTIMIYEKAGLQYLSYLEGIFLLMRKN